MNKKLQNKLLQLPNKPGVYFHKNSSNEIIYIGKAAVLRNRVRQYFQVSKYRDPKTDILINEIADTDWVELTSETEALFLEAELVKRYLPKYNILLRDDKSSYFIRINIKDHAPTVALTRLPADDGANYYGPYLQAGSLKKALRYLRKIFPYSTHTNLPNRSCLQYHLGLCPGPETDSYSRNEYIKNLKRLILIIKGKKDEVITLLEKEMSQASKSQKFEDAAIIRNRLQNLRSLQKQVIFGDRESMDLSRDHALAEIMGLFGLTRPPRRIEGYDISHMQGTDNVASMVVFEYGAPRKTAYRKFKMKKSGNDDFAHIAEVMRRRFSVTNQKKWGKPNLILIDGGKGQLTAAANVLKDISLNIPIIGLAKKYETIIIDKNLSNININHRYLQKIKGYSSDITASFISIELSNSSHVIKLLQRLRDESHRFAVNYHTVLKSKRQTKSYLDDIPGVGPKTKKVLLRHFGSVGAIKLANFSEIASITGDYRAKLLTNYFRYNK